MDFSLSEEQKSLRDGIIRFAQKELNDGASQRDKEQTFNRELWLKCGEMGIQGLPIPEAYGGSGLDTLSTMIALDALGYGCTDSGLVFSLGAHLCSCVVPIWKHGSEEQKRKYLPGLCDGSLIAVHGMSEPNSGSDAFAMLTKAVPDGDGFRINGTKTFSSNGPVADLALVFAVSDADKGYYGGITGFLIEKGTPGFRVGPKIEKMGLRTSQMSELVLDDVRVGPEAVLGSPGDGTVIFGHGMDFERIGIFASHVGTMQRLLEKVIAHARERTQFGQRIGKFQAVSHRIADMKVQLEAARLLTYQAAWRMDHVRSVSLDASMTKLFVSESLVKAALDTVQIFGGYGYMVEYEVERALRDAIASTIYSGTSEVQRNIIARFLGL
ncbi:MAG: acyl-CoA dehydrogenase family protein [Chloroflexi bacterium]|nr:acyl-CoA dehydrogenase family protein [Chloroflexota bacterium]MBI3733655.1 acyl-CoA dehydrogenase family protein [Chloroflexota bacterium]